MRRLECSCLICAANDAVEDVVVLSDSEESLPDIDINLDMVILLVCCLHGLIKHGPAQTIGLHM